MKILTALAAGFALLAVAAGNSFAIADQGGPKIGDVPPPLIFTKPIQGPATNDLTWEKLKGKVVVVEFWATWCGPCIKAIPHLNDLVEQFKDKPVVFISVTSENEDVVRLFLKNHPIKSAVMLDDFEVLNKAYHVVGIPHAFIVDAIGRIAAITPPQRLEATNLEEILAGKQCSLPEPEIYTVSKNSDESVPNQAPPLFEISIREHKMPANIRGPICMWSWDTNRCVIDGKIATVESALYSVFDEASSRVCIQCKLPDEYYDFELRAPLGHANELQNQFIGALRATFGIEAKPTTKVMEVYVMTQISTNAPGLREVEKSGGGGGMNGGFRLHGSPMKGLAGFLEEALRNPFSMRRD
ncbi:MAG TPA: TlpA disulfide reductase family protein [Verrucomicrobiae bacterium]|jgi:thiol-disulfide isomerase/thioredoxin|nr:TlpA disulfide reductase family protein [Verrucomicrobiae bacterium]